MVYGLEYGYHKTMDFDGFSREEAILQKLLRRFHESWFYAKLGID
jgi:hypothetical protein